MPVWVCLGRCLALWEKNRTIQIGMKGREAKGREGPKEKEAKAHKSGGKR